VLNIVTELSVMSVQQLHVWNEVLTSQSEEIWKKGLRHRRHMREVFRHSNLLKNTVAWFLSVCYSDISVALSTINSLSLEVK
jgi:hypothetical protein